MHFDIPWWIWLALGFGLCELMYRYVVGRVFIRKAEYDEWRASLAKWRADTREHIDLSERQIRFLKDELEAYHKALHDFIETMDEQDDQPDIKPIINNRRATVNLTGDQLASIVKGNPDITITENK